MRNRRFQILALVSALVSLALLPLLDWSKVATLPVESLVGLLAMAALGLISEQLALGVRVGSVVSDSSITFLLLYGSVLLFGPEATALFASTSWFVSGSDKRILFAGHKVLTERAHRIRVEVTVEWRGQRYTGEAAGADLPRARLETTATATLAAIEKGLALFSDEDGATLSLDGVKMVAAFDQTFVLVAVHAMHGRQVTALAGAAAVGDNPDRAVILGTLQATDRWIRGRI